MKRRCETCGKWFEAASPRFRFCPLLECRRRRARLRKRAQRGQLVPLRAPVVELEARPGVESATRAELERAGRLGTRGSGRARTRARRPRSLGRTGRKLAALHRPVPRETLSARLTSGQESLP
jgi:hypothetical protein